MKRVGVVTAIVAAVLWVAAVTPAVSLAGTVGPPSPKTGTSTTVPTSSMTAAMVPTTAGPPAPVPNPDNDHLFTVGDIQIPQGGEPGEVSVVAGDVIDSGHLLLIVRNNRDVPVYGISVSLTGVDSSGQDITAEFFIPSSGLAAGEWIFGQNALDVAGLDEITNAQVSVDASAQPQLFVPLEVTSAQLRGGVIVGTVGNSGGVDVGDFNVVSAACFDQSQPTAF